MEKTQQTAVNAKPTISTEGTNKVLKTSQSFSGFNNGPKKDNRDSHKPRKPYNRENKEFEERIISIKRISKTTKGGRMMRFSTLVVIGDKKGRVGFGLGKSAEIPDAMKKAIKNAKKQLFNVKVNKHGTVYHEIIGHHGASKVLLKPASDGTGLIAGGAIRAVIELAGYSNVYTKNLGAKSAINMVRATINGLQQIHTPLEIARLRDKNVKDL